MANQAFALGKNSYRVYYLQFVKGLAEYRAGHFASAVEWVGKSIGQPTMVLDRDLTLRLTWCKRWPSTS